MEIATGSEFVRNETSLYQFINVPVTKPALLMRIVIVTL